MHLLLGMRKIYFDRKSEYEVGLCKDGVEKSQHQTLRWKETSHALYKKLCTPGFGRKITGEETIASKSPI
jgi:hypothetical protein